MLYRLALIVLALCLNACADAPVSPSPSAAPASERPAPAKRLTADPAVHTATLDNGLRLYLRQNGEPQQRVLLKLVVKAGSLMETDAERGLAHFVEHMAFNGTRRFPKNALIQQLQAMGVEFGSHLNASTSFGETIYQLSVPTDKPENLRKALTILRDWADGLTFPEDEVIKERGVVLEEWRGRKGVGERLQEQLMPLLYAGSRYLERKPIGTPEHIQQATAAQLRAFYQRWYVPQRMALIAVGDLAPLELEQEIHKQFGDMARRDAPALPHSPLPRPKGARFATLTDAEMTATAVELAFLQPETPFKSEADYRQLLIRQLALAVMAERLEELANRPQAPVLQAGVSAISLSRELTLYRLAARISHEQILPGFAALQKEITRTARLGISDDELQRQLADYLASLTQAERDRQRIPSSRYSGDYIAHFLEDEPYLSLSEELRLSRRFAATLTPAELQAELVALFGSEHRLALITGPKDAALRYPEAATLGETLRRAAAEPPEALAQAANTTPLMQKPAPGRLHSERQLAELGVTELRYQNGVTVVLKPTDFEAGQILMQARSPGGLSLLPESDARDAALAADLVEQSGYGAWSYSALRKRTAGQLLSFSPFIGDYEEGLSGQTRPEDLETLLQLSHLAFTAPRFDKAAFDASRARLKEAEAKRRLSSQQRFAEAIRQRWTGDASRFRPWSAAQIDGLSLQNAELRYRERFADAGDFTFYLVGSFKLDAIKPLLASYLGSLPDSGRREKAVSLQPPTWQGQASLILAEASEPRTEVRLIFNSPARWDRQELYLYGSLRRILENRLREEIRENRSGVYHIDVSGDLHGFPKPYHEAQIAFSCAPERAEELTAAVREVLATLRDKGVSAQEIAAVLTVQQQDYESRQRDNDAWLDAISFYRQAGWDEQRIFLRDFPQLRKTLTAAALQSAARRYFTLDNLLIAQLTPSPPTPGAVAVSASAQPAATPASMAQSPHAGSSLKK